EDVAAGIVDRAADGLRLRFDVGIQDKTTLRERALVLPGEEVPRDAINKARRNDVVREGLRAAGKANRARGSGSCIARRPSVARKQQFREIAVPHGLGGHAGRRRRGSALVPCLPVEQPEGAIFPNRTGDNGAILVPAQLVFGLSGWQEETARIEPVVAGELEERAMQAVGSGLDRYIDLSARIH